MELYVSSVTGKKRNTSYPFRAVITSLDDLKNAVQYDHVCACYADGKNTKGRIIKGYRSKKTFKSSNCLPMDCDNTNPNPLEPDIPSNLWKTPQDVAAAFPDVPFYVVYSRNHMKEKDGKEARPRFHIYFPMEEVSELKRYEKLKADVQRHFPAFDDNAIDGARFFFGVEDPKIEYFAGNTLINQFTLSDFYLPHVIPTGSRNSTLSEYAGRILKRHGNTDKARELFEEASSRCDPPLDATELKTIWRSALDFYNNKIATDPTYIPPEEFDPDDFTQDDEGMVTSDDIRRALKTMGITVRLDVISSQVEITGMPEQYSYTNAANTLPTLIYDYFSKRGIRVTKQVIEDSLILIEDENRFNPVEEMVTSTTWDGEDRISALISILGISHDEDYILIFTKWLHQCIAMALNDDMEPYGADGAFVIQGPQGCGKTFFCRTIAMKSDWFAEGISIDLDKKDSIIQATGKWIAEMGELDSTLKREQSALKAFVTSAKDTYRLPYAKVAVNKPRRTSFCATVNPKEFLNDETGSRRFWVVEPTDIDVASLKELDADWLRQLWTQVYHTLFLPDPQGFRLTDEERERLEKRNEQYSKPIPGEIEILDQLHWEVPVEKWQWKKTSDLIKDLNLRGVNANQIGRVLTKLMKRDGRIKCKAPHNVKHYLVPPRWIKDFDYLDDTPAFAENTDDFLS